MATVIRQVKLVPEPTGNNINWQQHMTMESAALDAIQKQSDDLPDGDVVGFLVRFPKGDGYALYRVVKAKPLQLEHISFGDNWQADGITIRGLRLTDVLLMQKQLKLFRASYKGPR